MIHQLPRSSFKNESSQLVTRIESYVDQQLVGPGPVGKSDEDLTQIQLRYLVLQCTYLQSLVSWMERANKGFPPLQLSFRSIKVSIIQ